MVVSGGRGNGSSVEFWDMQTDKVSQRLGRSFWAGTHRCSGCPCPDCPGPGAVTP